MQATQPDIAATAVTTQPAGRRFWRSIFFKQLSLYLLLILLISGVIGYFFLATARQHLEAEVGQKLQDIARISARNADLERLELIRVGDDRTRMVLRLKEKLGQIREATGIRNIYIFRTDRTALLDLDESVRIGSPYRLPQLSAADMRQLEAGASVHTPGYEAGPEEIFVSAYAPVLQRDGKLFAVVGVEAGAGELAIIERMSKRLYWIACGSIAAAVGLALVLARSITRPIRHISHTAARLGRGEYEARASVESADEVGVLAIAVNQMAEQVRQRDAALKEMAASVAHEIRNPLNSIKLLIDLLDEELGEQKDGRPSSTIETLHYEIGKLNRFIGEFLTYSRPQATEREAVSACDLVGSVMDMAAAEAVGRQVRVETECEAGLPALQVDRLRLEQTLLNIVLNAIQACQRDGRVDLRVLRRPDGRAIEFIVEDTGAGIPAEALPRLFEPFFTTKAEGTGLGLANARKIVEDHQGYIRAEQRASGGARFVVSLPV